MQEEQMHAPYLRSHVGISPNGCEGAYKPSGYGGNSLLTSINYQLFFGPQRHNICDGFIGMEGLKGVDVYNKAAAFCATWDKPSVDEVIAKVEEVCTSHAHFAETAKQRARDINFLRWEDTASAIVSG